MLKIAYRFMVYDKPKLIGALVGVVIATYLIGQQVGVFTFLTNAMRSLADNTKTEMWVVDPYTTNVNALGQIDMRVGREIESIEGVAKVYPVVIAGSSARFQNGKTFGVTIIGSQAPDFVGGPWNLAEGTTSDLFPDGAVTTEYFDRKNMGNVVRGDFFEISGKRVYSAAVTKGVRGFGPVFVFTTLERARYLGKVPTSKVSAFLLKLEPGTDSIKVRDEINRRIFGVKAWLPKEFAKATQTTILGSSGIAISTYTQVFFAVIIGFVIVGLSLYSSAIDRLKDYATMKAIGANNNYLRKLIITQTLIIAFVGFSIGTFFVEMFRFGISKAGTIFNFTLTTRLTFLTVILVVSMTGALFAIRRITKAEPASVFRN